MVSSSRAARRAHQPDQSPVGRLEAAALTHADIAGVGLAWLGAGTIRAFLFQVQPLDPVTLGGVSRLILVLALAVSLRAALRAARVDLSSLLKAE
jgi:hypothetical protein